MGFVAYFACTHPSSPTQPAGRMEGAHIERWVVRGVTPGASLDRLFIQPVSGTERVEGKPRPCAIRPMIANPDQSGKSDQWSGLVRLPAPNVDPCRSVSTRFG